MTDEEKEKLKAFATGEEQQRAQRDFAHLHATRANRDPVLHETLTAIYWTAHAVSAINAGFGDLAKMFADYARASVLQASKLADDAERSSKR